MYFINSRIGEMMKDRMLSVNDICKYLGISRDTVYRWIEERGFPAYRLGRLWKFKKEEVDEWIKNNGGSDIIRRPQ